MKPIILVTPDIETVDTRRGPAQRYVGPREYLDAIVDAGGAPVLVPYAVDALDALVAVAHGVVLSGGAFDVDPALFGEAPHEKLGTLKPDRTKTEVALYEKATQRGLPLLGVCGGMQLVNVLRGGTLWQDLPSQAPSHVPHEQAGPKHEAAHDVAVVAGTRLAALVGATKLGVNSTHHQAVRALAPGLAASAVADDGVVEAFEDPARPFFVGVQWHPEAMRDAAHRAIYRGLVDAAKAFTPR